MSCDWHIHCVDCGETHLFDDTNNEEKLMHLLCNHAATIASLAPLVVEAKGDIEIKVGYRYGKADVAWFVRHHAHKLVPIDEYGVLSGKCYRSALCGACNNTHRCSLDRDHDGACR